MDETTIMQINCIMAELRRMAYAIKRPEFIVFDLDSTLLDTYGNQEGKAFNFHYQNVGYHPLLCYDSLTKDLYQASSWKHPRRVVFRIEKPHGQMIYMYTFVVASMESEAQQLIRAYCKRGTMENFIKEGKNEFGSYLQHSDAW